MKSTIGFCVVFLSVLFHEHVIESAPYGATCVDEPCTEGMGLICSTSGYCLCSTGYTHRELEDGCQAITSPYPDQVFVPDLIIGLQQAVFQTNLTATTLDTTRKLALKMQLESQLDKLFKGVTGFKSAEVTKVEIILDSDSDDGQLRLLIAMWMIRIRRDDPAFLNATDEQIVEILRPQLQNVSARYQELLHLDTSWSGEPGQYTADKSDHTMELGLGLGLGLGLALVVIVVLLLVWATLKRKKGSESKTLTISDVSSSHPTDGSSKMDPDNYQYSIAPKDTNDNISLAPTYVSLEDKLDKSSAIYLDIIDGPSPRS